MAGGAGDSQGAARVRGSVSHRAMPSASAAGSAELTRSYAHNHPTSRPKLYEFNLVSTVGRQHPGAWRTLREGSPLNARACMSAPPSIIVLRAMHVIRSGSPLAGLLSPRPAHTSPRGGSFLNPYVAEYALAGGTE